MAYRYGIDDEIVVDLIRYSMAMAEVRKTDEAIQIFEAACAYRENPIKPMLCIGLALSYAERYEEAVDWFEKVCLRYPEFWTAHAMLASAMRGANQTAWYGVAENLAANPEASPDAVEMAQALIALGHDVNGAIRRSHANALLS
jgi:tetratricopeptide (TPR) repeat protein